MVSTWKPCGVHLNRTWCPCKNHVVSTWKPCGVHIWNHVVSTWKLDSVHVETTWYPYGNHVVSTWITHGVHVATMLCPYRNHMVSMWKPHCFHMETMWCPHLKPCGVHLETTLCPHRSHMVSRWKSYGDHMDTTCIPCGHEDIISYVTSDAIRSRKITNIWMPVTSLILVWFSIRKKFWKALDILYQIMVIMLFLVIPISVKSHKISQVSSAMSSASVNQGSWLVSLGWSHDFGVRYCEISPQIFLPFKEQSCWYSSAKNKSSP